MRYYEIAAAAWNNRINKSGRDREVGFLLRSDTALRACPAVQSLITETDAGSEKFHTQPMRIGKSTIQPPRPGPGQTLAEAIEQFAIYDTGSKVGEQPAILWSCAAAKIAEVEKH